MKRRGGSKKFTKSSPILVKLMKIKPAAFIFLMMFISINFLFSSPPQDLNIYPVYWKSSFNLNSLDVENDAKNNITRAENLITRAFEIILGMELNDGEVWYFYICLTQAIRYLNRAERELLNGDYNNAINKAKKAEIIAKNIIPVSLLKAIETLSHKQFIMFILPLIIIIISISIILGIILIYYARKYYYRKKTEKDFLKKKIMIPNGETKVNK